MRNSQCSLCTQEVSNAGSPEHLPHAHTCVNKLVLHKCAVAQMRRTRLTSFVGSFFFGLLVVLELRVLVFSGALSLLLFHGRFRAAVTLQTMPSNSHMSDEELHPYSSTSDVTGTLRKGSCVQSCCKHCPPKVSDLLRHDDQPGPDDPSPSYNGDVVEWSCLLDGLLYFNSIYIYIVLYSFLFFHHVTFSLYSGLPGIHWVFGNPNGSVTDSSSPSTQTKGS